VLHGLPILRNVISSIKVLETEIEYLFNYYIYLYRLWTILW
jgi:hypothetical protein